MTATLSPTRVPLHEALGMARDERVIICILPGQPDHVDMEPVPALVQECYTARSHLRYLEGQAGAEYSGRVLDIARADGGAIRWWQVVNHCRDAGLDHVPIYYDGALEEVSWWLIGPAEERGDEVLLRRTRSGPWVSLRGSHNHVTYPGEPAFHGLTMKESDGERQEADSDEKGGGGTGVADGGAPG